MTMSGEELCEVLSGLMREGSVIPFLGAGIGRYERSKDDDWEQSGLLPDGRELAKYLANKYRNRGGPDPTSEPPPELLGVAQYVETMIGRMDLRKDLNKTFTRTEQPTALHKYLAEQPAQARQAGLPNPWPLIVTTNYDDLLELAFEAADEPFDLVTYSWRKGDALPVFLHRHHDGEMKPIDRPKKCDDFDFERRPVILKLHGSVARDERQVGHFVITEDDYIRYISKGINDRLPPSLVAQMLECHFLFLGYRLADWNLRAFLFSVWEDRHDPAQSWAIRKCFGKLEAQFWLDHKVTLVKYALEEWVSQMLETELGLRPLQ